MDTLENIDPINTSIETINSIIDDCNSILKNAAEQADMFVTNSNSSYKRKANNSKEFASRKFFFPMMNVMSNVKQIECLANIIRSFSD